jgi:hypothetical protein
MWIASKLGFFSVVRKSADEFHIRARVRNDLDNLVRAGFPAAVVPSYPGSDYHWRILATAAQMPQLWQLLGESVDYDNFKSEIGRTPDQREKLHAYHEIWSIMHRLQERP